MSSPLTPSPRRRLSLNRLPSACLLLALCPLISAGQGLTPPSPQQPAPADVVSRITAARTIFLSNASGNDYFNGQIPGGPNVSYNQLYAALQQWGYFHLADSPAHADLIFQIRGTELAPNLAMTVYGNLTAQQHRPQLELTILDPATLTPIDTITAPAGRGDTIPKGSIAFARSIEWLTYQISTRVSAPRTNPGKLISRDTLRPSFETLIQFTAPVPPQVLNAKSIYLQNDAPTDPKPNPHSLRYFEGLRAALATWDYYHLTDSPKSADVIFHYHDDPANGTYVTLEDPATKAILWTLTDPRFGFYRQSGQRRVTALNQNLITQLKQLNHIPLSPSETAALH